MHVIFLFLLQLAGCAIVRPYEALIIGVIGAIVALACTELIEKLKIDDPVGAVAVHGASGIWVCFTVFGFRHETTRF